MLSLLICRLYLTAVWTHLQTQCFGALLICGHRGIVPGCLGLAIHDYTAEDMAIREKKQTYTQTNKWRRNWLQWRY